MRNNLIAASVAALLSVSAAHAGGFTAPVVEIEPPLVVTPAPSDWQGAYAGITLGYAFGGDDDIGAPEHSRITTCAYCGVGCTFKAEMRGEELVHMVQSSDVPVDLGVVRERYEAEQAHHAAFSEKRHQHYGNEAAALKRRPPPEEEEEEDEA